MEIYCEQAITYFAKQFLDLQVNCVPLLGTEHKEKVQW